MIVKDLLGGQIDTCTPDTRLAEAARRMMADEVGSLAVVDRGALVGILTERDVLRTVAEGRPGTTRVDRIMTPDPDSLAPDIEIEEATDWMMAAGYRHLPVLEGSTLLGMVSLKDLVWAITERDRSREARK